uniref:Uncharacterized protein n=1 Tax=Noccaea caerulescens TaxID=107243 RepID=A0A1J3CTX7_NOCCA
MKNPVAQWRRDACSHSLKRVLFDPLIKGIPKETDQKLAEIVERCLSAQPPTFKEITWFLKPVASKTNQKPPGSYHYR